MANMIGILPAVLLALTVTVGQDKPAAKSNEATEKMLIANERALQDAVARADKSSFTSLVLLSDGFWTTTDGFVLVRELADGLHHFQLTKWDMINPRVTWLDEDSVIVSYVWTGAGTFLGQPVSPMALATTVWTKRNGQWLAVNHQQTQLIKK